MVINLMTVVAKAKNPLYPIFTRNLYPILRSHHYIRDFTKIILISLKLFVLKKFQFMTPGNKVKRFCVIKKLFSHQLITEGVLITPKDDGSCIQSLATCK